MAPMKLLSVNVGLPREIEFHGKLVRTSIFKSPASGQVRVATLNLEGDEQSDLSVHGGAIRRFMPTHLSTTHSGARKFRAWTYLGERSARTSQRRACSRKLFTSVTASGLGLRSLLSRQPRMPCFKLGIRFGCPEIMKRFLRSGRTGFYLAVLQEGRGHRWRLDGIACQG